ncbi:hypothetical protein RR21198_3250 [Rhodococcus rhodochrous ATCC 21198]|nr:hypothetical protein RR21198_3250 [Rhodococcus rhodochrous ATCC 21198]
MYRREQRIEHAGWDCAGGDGLDETPDRILLTG